MDNIILIMEKRNIGFLVIMMRILLKIKWKEKAPVEDVTLLVDAWSLGRARNMGQ